MKLLNTNYLTNSYCAATMQGASGFMEFGVYFPLRYLLKLYINYFKNIFDLNMSPTLTAFKGIKHFLRSD